MSPFCTRFLVGLPRGILAKDKFVFSTIVFRAGTERFGSSLVNPFTALGIERRHVGFVGFNPIAARKRLRHVDSRLELLP